MNKRTKIILFCWDDSKALSLTRQINREFPDSADLHVGDARIEIDFEITKDQVMQAIRNCNIFQATLPRGCKKIEYAEVTYRTSGHIFVDLYLTETSEMDVERVTSPIQFQKFNATRTWGL